MRCSSSKDAIFLPPCYIAPLFIVPTTCVVVSVSSFICGEPWMQFLNGFHRYKIEYLWIVGNNYYALSAAFYSLRGPKSAERTRILPGKVIAIDITQACLIILHKIAWGSYMPIIPATQFQKPSRLYYVS